MLLLYFNKGSISCYLRDRALFIVPLIYCPECKKQISDKAEACPHCGLPKTYFAPKIVNNEITILKQKEENATADYKTLRNMLIAFDRDYSEIFNSKRYIASSTARAFYNSYVYYVGALKDPIVKK